MTRPIGRSISIRRCMSEFRETAGERQSSATTPAASGAHPLSTYVRSNKARLINSTTEPAIDQKAGASRRLLPNKAGVNALFATTMVKSRNSLVKRALIFCFRFGPPFSR